MHTTLKDKEVKIRKERRCWGCTQTKSVGTLMQCIVNANSGEIYTTYWCEVCNAYVIKNIANFEDGVGYGEFKGEFDYDYFKKNYLFPKRRILIEKNLFLYNHGFSKKLNKN